MKLSEVRWIRTVGAAAVLFAGSAVAQTVPQAPPPEIPQPKAPVVYSPNLKTFPEAPGWKGAILQGATGGDGHRFMIPNLDVLQPVSVMLLAHQSGDALTLQLFKDDFKKPLKEASTSDKLNARLNIRTQGDLRILVTSNQGVKDYQLVVMVGNEVKVPVPSLFVPISYAGAAPGAAAPSKTAAGAIPAGGTAPRGSSPVMWIIAASLVVIMVLLGFIVFRKKSGQKSITILLVIALPAFVSGRLFGQAVSAPSQISIADTWRQDVTQLLQDLVKQYSETAKNVLELFDALAPSDESLWPQFTPPGIPGIPTACVAAIPQGVAKSINETTWTNPECAECYKAAHEEIAKALQRFEKLRRVHAKTVEVYNMSMTFGNGVAMVGGIITTAEWMKIRNGINETYASYNATYDAKVVELTAALVAALQKVAACELKFFNNASWYERYGFMFVNPVVERHRR